MSNIKETSYNHLSDTGQPEPYGIFCSSERKWITKIEKYAESHPDEVVIRNKNEDGSVVAQVPKSWFKLSPPKKMNYSEEQKAALRERLASGRQGGKVRND